MVIEVTKELYKKLYEVNQIAKNVFPFYVLDNTGVYPYNMDAGRGKSKLFYSGCETILNIIGVEGGESLVIDSTVLFSVYKEYKTKGFTRILKKDNDLIFRGDTDFRIGKIINRAETCIGHELFEIIDECGDVKVSSLLIQENEVSSLNKNECLRINYNGYKLIMTKELFPALKKKSTDVKCVVVPTDDIFFLLITSHDASGVTVKTIYKCIKF